MDDLARMEATNATSSEVVELVDEVEHVEGLSCLAWRQTLGCDPAGPLESGKSAGCNALIRQGRSGYCECEGGQRADGVGCEHSTFTWCASRANYSATTLTDCCRQRADLWCDHRRRPHAGARAAAAAGVPRRGGRAACGGAGAAVRAAPTAAGAEGESPTARAPIGPGEGRRRGREPGGPAADGAVQVEDGRLSWLTREGECSVL